MPIGIPTDKRRRNSLASALIKAIQATVRDAGTWHRLGYATNTREWIEDHPRLLRSLQYGDNDYEANVVSAVEHMINTDESNVDSIWHFGGIATWIGTNEPTIYAEFSDD